MARTGRAKGSGVTPLIERVMSRVEMVTESGCWLFTGYLNQHGYGKVGSGGKRGPILRTHRVTYEHFRGQIPAGLQLDHKCRVRSCCNPWHLEPVTFQENVDRSPIPRGVKRVLAPYPGIALSKGRWFGQVQWKKKRYRTRRFETPEQARDAHQALCRSIGVSGRKWM